MRPPSPGPTGETYLCESCGKTFQTDRPDDEQLAEAIEIFGAAVLDDPVLVCDDCWLGMSYLFTADEREKAQAIGALTRVVRAPEKRVEEAPPPASEAADAELEPDEIDLEIESWDRLTEEVDLGLA